MLPLLAPVLAQLVTLNVGDRTDVRYVHGDDTHYEGATRPLVGLNFGWRRSALQFAYAPSFTVTPLERDSRQLLVYQAASVRASHFWKHTVVSISEGVGYGRFAFQVQAVADPGATPPLAVGTPPPAAPTAPPVAPGGATPGGTTGNGTTNTPNPQATNQLHLTDNVVSYATSTTNVAVAHALSREDAIGANTSYTVAGGVGASSQQYPLIKGVQIGAYASDTRIYDRRSSFSSSLSGQYNTSSTGDNVWALFFTEAWFYKFNARTTSRLAAGLAGNRLSQRNGLVQYSIYPTAAAGISYAGRFAGGVLALGVNVGAAPYLDPLRATVDPRFGVSGNAGWAKQRFSIAAGAGAAISLADTNDQGAVNSVGLSLGSSYRLGRGFSIDGGATTGYQTFQGVTIIPASWTAYLGVTYGAQVQLNGHPQ
jgi:hypothetical protein